MFVNKILQFLWEMIIHISEKECTFCEWLKRKYVGVSFVSAQEVKNKMTVTVKKKYFDRP